jgi:uncharacterized membrane protein YGL010W
MKTLTEQLTTYASYHRDKRNVITHMFGIPMIVLSITVLLSRWSLGEVPMPWGGSDHLLTITWAPLVSLAACLYYLRLDFRYGMVMSALIGLACWVGSYLAQEPFQQWLLSGVGLFVVGWIFQFIGHYFEGKKPAFVDDLIGLLIGPLFVVAEAGFVLGLRKEVNADVVQKAGPLH